MSEQVAEVEQKQTQGASKLASFGRTEVFEVKPVVATETGGTGEVKADAVTETQKQVPASEAEIELSEEQLAKFFEKKGMKYEGLDKLKEKINYEPSLEPTVEQKEAAIKAKEKRVIDKFIAGGGTVEEYVSIKSVADADEKQFSINMAKNDLIKEGYTQEEAESLLKESFHQIDDAEIEQYEDETDKAFKKRTKEFFAKQLVSLSAPIKAKAANILAELHSAIESEDLQAQNEISTSAKIDEDFKAMPRKLTIEIGEIGGKTVSPVDYDLSETDLAESKQLLKDAVAQRNNFLYNEDGSLNVTNLATVISKAKAFDSAAKVSFLDGMDRMTKEFRKTFPAGSAQELGVGGDNQNRNLPQKGKLASIGKTKIA